MKKPEAPHLADELERYHGEYPACTESAAELRRLCAQRDALLIAMKLIQHATSPTPNDGGHHEAAHDISSAAIKAVEGEKNNG